MATQFQFFQGKVGFLYKDVSIAEGSSDTIVVPKNAVGKCLPYFITSSGNTFQSDNWRTIAFSGQTFTFSNVNGSGTGTWTGRIAVWVFNN